MGFSGTCACGRQTESFGGLCDRCVALQTLELHPHATDSMIEENFRTLVKVWHPDRFQTDEKTRLAAEEKLKEINEAHEFLLGTPDTQELPDTNSRPKPPPLPKDRFRAPVETHSTVSEIQESEPVEDLEKRKDKSPAPALLVKAGFAVVGLIAISLLWLVFDSVLSSSSMTAAAWNEYKGDVSRQIHANGLRIWATATDNVHAQKEIALSAPAPPSRPVSEQQAAPEIPHPPPILPQIPLQSAQPSPLRISATVNTARSPSAAPQPPIKVSSRGRTAQPYLTAGLTPLEVLATLGKPTSSIGEKMFYGKSEIDFRNGQVVGWNVDPTTSRVHVKLWPNAAINSDLGYFVLGSTKSDVIALQGTPTFFSDTRFGYGNSTVLFQNDRVVGWNEDPSSVHLRVAH